MAKLFNATGQVACRRSGGYRTSWGLTTIYDIKAATKKQATRVARRTWRTRKELPAPGCTLYLSVEEI